MTDREMWKAQVELGLLDRLRVLWHGKIVYRLIYQKPNEKIIELMVLIPHIFLAAEEEA